MDQQKKDALSRQELTSDTETTDATQAVATANAADAANAANAADAAFQPGPLAPCDPALLGACIQGVWQRGEDWLVLETHHGEPAAVASWRFSLDAHHTRLTREFRKQGGKGGKTKAPAFCQWLRGKLVGGSIVGVTLRHPQLLELRVARQIDGETEAFVLLLEMNRRYANLLLLDGSDNLLIAMRHPSLGGRKLGPGKPYVPPPRIYPYPGDIPLANRYPAPDAATAQARAEYWKALEWEAKESATNKGEASREGEWRKAARGEVKKLRRRLKKLEEDLQDSQSADQWKKHGELLQIHRHLITPGAAQVEVPDVFDPTQPTVRIALDPRADPGENVERCFARFRKLRDSVVHVTQRLGESREALAQWEGLLEALPDPDSGAAKESPSEPPSVQSAKKGPPAAAGPANQANTVDPEELARRFPVVAKLLAAKLLAGRLPTGKRMQQAPSQGQVKGGAKGRGKGSAQIGAGVMTRTSADGYTVLIGRSKTENAEVTFRLGNGRDWWFHAQGIPGSHVLVKTPDGEALPRQTVLEAAWLAAYYSQARGKGTGQGAADGKVDVDYTQRKWVRKIKGAEPGQVTISQNKTVLVDLADAKLKQVLGREW